MSGVFPAHDTLARAFFLVEGDAARGGLGIFLDFGFTLGGLAPIGVSPAVLDDFGQFGVILRAEDVTVTEGSGAFQQ